MEELKEKALAYLEANPELTEIHATRDGFLFYKKADAVVHAATLDVEPQVESFTKTEEVKTEEVKTEEVKTEEVKTEEVKTEEVKTEEVKKQKATKK